MVKKTPKCYQMLNRPSRIHCFVHMAMVIKPAFREERTLVHKWRELENNRSTETAVTGIAR